MICLASIGVAFSGIGILMSYGCASVDTHVDRRKPLWWIGLICWIVSLLMISIGLIVWETMTAGGTEDDQLSCTARQYQDSSYEWSIEKKVCPVGHSFFLALVGFLAIVVGTVFHASPPK